MSITYRGIIGNKAAVTMPSVESWGTNNNILRDPPKSIMTRRIDKVNQDGSLNEMFYHSGDRFAEHVNVYARGVNPMVSVEYGNSNSFGMSKNNGNSFYSAGKLPYRIMQGGAFHPPLLRQEQLLPLSRQPRNVTFVATNKESIDYAKSALCNQQPKEHRQIVKNKVEGYITPTKTMKIDAPTKEFFVQNYVNDDPLMYNYNTNLSAVGETNFYTEEKSLEKNLPQHEARTQKSVNYALLVRPDKEVMLEANTPNYNVTATRSINIATGGVLNDNIELDSNLPHYQVRDTKVQNMGGNGVLNDYIDLDSNLPHYQVRDTKFQNMGGNGVLNDNINLDVNMPHHFVNNNKGYNNGSRAVLNEEIYLSENVPHYAFEVNKGDSRVQFQNKYENELDFQHKTPHVMIQSPKTQNTKTTEVQSKQFDRLHETVHPGSMEGRVIIPTSDRNMTYNVNYTTNKRDIAKKIMRERA